MNRPPDPPDHDIPSSTPCDNCGTPASHIGSTGVEEYVWCDDCDARGYPFNRATP